MKIVRFYMRDRRIFQVESDGIMPHFTQHKRLLTGTFCLTKQELLCLLDETDREIMELSMQICSNGTYDFDQAFGKLFAWCQKTM